MVLKLVALAANIFFLTLANWLISEKIAPPCLVAIPHNVFLFAHPSPTHTENNCARCDTMTELSETGIEHIKPKVCSNRNNDWADILLI